MITSAKAIRGRQGENCSTAVLRTAPATGSNTTGFLFLGFALISYQAYIGLWSQQASHATGSGWFFKGEWKARFSSPDCFKEVSIRWSEWFVTFGKTSKDVLPGQISVLPWQLCTTPGKHFKGVLGISMRPKKSWQSDRHTFHFQCALEDKSC